MGREPACMAGCLIRARHRGGADSGRLPTGASIVSRELIAKIRRGRKAGEGCLHAIQRCAQQ